MAATTITFDLELGPLTQAILALMKEIDELKYTMGDDERLAGLRAKAEMLFDAVSKEIDRKRTGAV
jgi:hypothetical protein